MSLLPLPLPPLAPPPPLHPPPIQLARMSRSVRFA
jgi:hypothetical protein